MDITKEVQTACYKDIKYEISRLVTPTRNKLRLLIMKMHKGETDPERKEFFKRFFYVNQLDQPKHQVDLSKHKDIISADGILELCKVLDININDVFQFTLLPIGENSINVSPTVD